MTLVVTVATHNFIAQASDRRFTKPSGELFRDDANKAVIVDCRDGTLALAYSGLGFIGTLRTDDWVVEVLSRRGEAGMAADEAIATLAEEATRAVRKMNLSPETKRTSFYVAGWPKALGWRMPMVWCISNYERFETSEMGFRRSRSSAKPAPDFTTWATWPKPQGHKFYVVTVAGRDPAVRHARKQLRRLQHFILSNSDPRAVTRKLVAFIRRCAYHPKEGKHIGRNCMALFISDQERMALYYPEDSSRGIVFAPNFVWLGGPAVRDVMWGTGKGPSIEEIQRMMDDKRKPQKREGE